MKRVKLLRAFWHSLQRGILRKLVFFLVAGDFLLGTATTPFLAAWPGPFSRPENRVQNKEALNRFQSTLGHEKGLNGITRCLQTSRTSISGRRGATPTKYLAWGRLQKLKQVSPGKCAHKAMQLGHVTKLVTARPKSRGRREKCSSGDDFFENLISIENFNFVILD